MRLGASKPTASGCWRQPAIAQYEVSAYAREGSECRHNLNYWLFGDYLGLGAGAHGKLSLGLPGKILRTAKPKQPRDYQERVKHAARAGARRNSAAEEGGGTAEGSGAGRHFVPIADLPFEFMLNALRLNEGFPTSCFESRTGLPAAAISAPMHAAEARGLVEPTDNGWKPTDLGRRFLNDLQTGFLA